MVIKKTLRRALQHICEDMADDMHALREDVDKNLQAVLEKIFARLNLVTREEFEAQKKVLASTRQTLDQLSSIIAKLEGKTTEK